jgi:hypothetical protein
MNRNASGPSVTTRRPPRRTGRAPCLHGLWRAFEKALDPRIVHEHLTAWKMTQP